MKQPTLLMILDGWGIGKPYPGNAIHLANTPVMDDLLATRPHTQIEASGLAVGLPAGQMGNSEVGHLNIGTGRVVYQELTRIGKEIEEGAFAQNPEILQAIEHALQNGTSLHLMGLLSDGGVHSHIEHLFALLDVCNAKGLRKVYVHAFLDGRDVSPTSGAGFVRDLQNRMRLIGTGEIATVMGRYYAMDRDNRWERVQRAYEAIVNGVGLPGTDPVRAVEDSYAKEVTDEFVEPIVCMKDGAPIATLSENDSVLFFNFRPDRGRELTRAITDPEFAGFLRPHWFPTHYVTMTEYDKTFTTVHVAYRPEQFDQTLGEYVSSLGLTQLRIAETEKYPHVTFFFNGGREVAYAQEDRILVPSPKVATYDLQPEMSAPEVRDKVVEAIRSGKYDLIILNFANSDMVGHTGVIPAAIKAVETVDACMGDVIAAVLAMGGQMLITADHGNSEKMLEDDGAVCTAHTTNPVPLLLLSDETVTLKEGGRLCDLAPTLLDMMHLPQPEAMTGQSLLERGRDQ